MANPAQRPAGTKAENHPNNERRKHELITGPAAGVSIVCRNDVAEMVDVVKVVNALKPERDDKEKIK